MSQQNTPSLMESIQAEVSKEASPLLQVLVRNARLITFVLVALIIAIAVAGGWRFYNKQQSSGAVEELGSILVRPSAGDRVSRLEAYLQNAKPEYRFAALLAMAESAGDVGDYEKAAAAWEQAAEQADESFKIVARVGQAGALARLGKNEEALTVLESALPSANAEAAFVLNSRIVDLAEMLGHWDRAVRACDDILNSSVAVSSKTAWEQRRSYLSQKKAVAAN